VSSKAARDAVNVGDAWNDLSPWAVFGNGAMKIEAYLHLLESSKHWPIAAFPDWEVTRDLLRSFRLYDAPGS
jgi:hypothetical protein